MTTTGKPVGSLRRFLWLFTARRRWGLKVTFPSGRVAWPDYQTEDAARFAFRINAAHNSRPMLVQLTECGLVRAEVRAAPSSPEAA